MNTNLDVASGKRPRKPLAQAGMRNGSKKIVPAWARMPELNTWRAFEENISQQGIMEFVEQWEAHGFRFGSFTIDEGWTSREAAFGDWRPDEKRFPDLRGLVDWLHAKGIRARLWIAPLLVNDAAKFMQTPLKKHLLIGKGGERIRQLGRNAMVLDARVGEVQQHIAATFERLTRDYDVDGFKVDFIFMSAGDEPSGYLHDNVSEKERSRMHAAMFPAIRSACDAVKAGVRLETYPLEEYAEFIDDSFWNDLVGPGRTQEGHERINARLLELSRDHGWVTWPEMIWGLGSNTPAGNPNWERTYFEWLATDINYERKLELSFPPFHYSNCAQIRTFTNLYASGGPLYKVAHAGNVAFDPFKLEQNGIQLSRTTRFLAAPHVESEVHCVIPPSCGMPSEWEVVSLLDSERVRWQVRDENWEDGKRWHCLRFIGRAGGVYEIHHR